MTYDCELFSFSDMEGESFGQNGTELCWNLCDQLERRQKNVLALLGPACERIANVTFYEQVFENTRVISRLQN